MTCDLQQAVVWGDEPEAVGILTYVMDETAVAELQRQQQPTSSDSTSERRSPSANDAAAPIMATIVTPDDGQQVWNPCQTVQHENDALWASQHGNLGYCGRVLLKV